jgi:nucleobase:cation symporter-1, NCS1 family
MAAATSSPGRLVERLETKEHRTAAAENRHQWLDNNDLRPVPVAERTYSWKDYFWFWLSANATPASFYGVSAALAAGLSVWEALACQLGGQSKLSSR